MWLRNIGKLPEHWTMPPLQQSTTAISVYTIVPRQSAFHSLNARETLYSSVPTFRCLIAGSGSMETIDNKVENEANHGKEQGKSSPDSWSSRAFPTRIENLSHRQSYRNSPNRLARVLEEIEVGNKSSLAPAAPNVVTKNLRKKKRSVGALLLLPLKKLRDKYVSCMLYAEGAGDLTVLVAGGAYIASPARFPCIPEKVRRIGD